MTFSELRKELNNDLQQVNSNQDYLTKYLTTTFRSKIEELNEKFTEHLFSDLTHSGIKFNIQEYLGSSYLAANEFAQECVSTVFKSKDIYGFKITGWTDNALKCFDNFILVLIQDILKEEIKKKSNLGIERQKYAHLIEKGSQTPYYKIGMGLDIIYKCRNEFNHIEYIDDATGKRRQKPLSKKNINLRKEHILNGFKLALNELATVIS